ncbi:MAG: Crp/Fnr family transcriptional regulator [Dehalococcoidales bacterium]|nr:Crp/Fnr family transcriptional regulator [Dehalococcoidales bacterium]
MSITMTTPTKESVHTVDEFLRSFPYFARLSAADLARLRGYLSVRQYGRGDLIVLEREPCKGLFLVRFGRVRVYKASPDGREKVLRVVEAGESFNEVPNFDGGGNPATAEATEPTTVYCLRRADLLRIVGERPSVGLAMLEVFAGRLRHLTAMVEDLSFRQVTSRLAKILLEYAGQAPAADGGGLELRRRLTQQEMAAMVGTAREMVGRSLKNLEAQGALRVDRHRIIIVDRELLESLV